MMAHSGCALLPAEKVVSSLKAQPVDLCWLCWPCLRYVVALRADADALAVLESFSLSARIVDDYAFSLSSSIIVSIRFILN